MNLQDYQTEEPITTKKIIYEGDKKIETTISKKKNKTTNYNIARRKFRR